MGYKVNDIVFLEDGTEVKINEIYKDLDQSLVQDFEGNAWIVDNKDIWKLA